jgi:hypothetical protein
VKQLPVHGERVHDARIVAVLQAHAVEHLLTFNGADFVASFMDRPAFTGQSAGTMIVAERKES